MSRKILLTILGIGIVITISGVVFIFLLIMGGRDNRNLIDASINYRKVIDTNNLDKCDESARRETIINDVSLDYSVGFQKIIDSFNSERDCFYDSLRNNFSALESLNIELEKINCEKVDSSDKCEYMKSSIPLLISADQDIMETTLQFYEDTKAFWYCYNTSETEGEECIVADQAKLEDLLSKFETESDKLREYTKFYASL